MRRASRIDANQAEVVAALRAIGCSVQSLAPIGKGCPDLLVALAGRMTLLEVKDGDKPPSARQLTPDQVRWHMEWRAPVHVVETVEQAIAAVTGGAA